MEKFRILLYSVRSTFASVLCVAFTTGLTLLGLVYYGKIAPAFGEGRSGRKSSTSGGTSTQKGTIAGTSWGPSYVQIGLPQSKPLTEDPLKVLSRHPIQGRLVYSANIFAAPGDKPSWEKYLVLRHVGLTNGERSFARYPVKAPFGVFDPQFSPDRRYVLFKGGQSGGRYDHYLFFLWNLQTKQVRQVQQGSDETPSYLRLHWSPSSKYIAYLMGGDVEGERDPRDPLRLYTYNLKTGRKSFIARDPSVKSLSWTHQDTLLYTKMSESQSAAVANGTQNEREGVSDVPVLHPSIFEASAQGGLSKKIVDGGFDPSPSPDGQWIAYLGWSNDAPNALEEDQGNVGETGEPKPGSAVRKKATSKLPESANHLNLYLFNRLNFKRMLIRSGLKRDNPFELFWMPDSKKLVTMETATEGTLAEAIISAVDIPSLHIRQVATLHALDDASAPRLEADPVFDALGASAVSNSMFVKVSEFRPSRPRPSRPKGGIVLDALKVVDLDNGSIFPLCQFERVSGFDWSNKD